MTRSQKGRASTLTGVLVLASMSLVGMPAVHAAPAPHVVAPSAAPVLGLSGDPGPDAFELKVLRLTNKARAKSRRCGGKRMKKAKPLRWNSTLAATAHEHSADMATNDYFSHYTPTGVSPFTRIRTAGYDYRAAGENIAAGTKLATPKAVVKAWLKSPTHCRVLMNRTYRDLGVGRVQGAGTWTIYWTQNFGRSR